MASYIVHLFSVLLFGDLSSGPAPSPFDDEARRLDLLLHAGPRVAILGSTDFWHPESERTCVEVGKLLAAISGLVLLTGGVEGIGEAVGRSFFQTRCDSKKDALVYHLLPSGEEAWDYGETILAGADMSERREILGRMSRLFVLIEGGPRAGHEVDVALAQGATVIPVGRSGGFAETLYSRMACPSPIDADTWATLGSPSSGPTITAQAVCCAVERCLGALEI